MHSSFRLHLKRLGVVGRALEDINKAITTKVLGSFIIIVFLEEGTLATL